MVPDRGAWVSFDTTGATPVSRVVTMKVGIYYVSPAGAMVNLRVEDPEWSLPAISNKAHNRWNQMLSQITVGGGTHEDQVKFYNGVYHSLLHPNVFSDADADGKYAGFDGQVHQHPAGQVQYANYSGWDIYRSEVPLLAMLAPEETSQMMTSMLRDQSEMGWLPKWSLNNREVEDRASPSL